MNSDNQDDYAQALILEDSSIRDAMMSLERSNFQIVLVLNSKKQLTGILTDGDIRRAFLSGASSNDIVRDFINRKYFKVNPKVGRAEVIDLMIANDVKQVPVVDDENIICGLHLLNKLTGIQQKPNSVLILAGGLGTRLKPLTNKLPKPMVNVAGRPILERIILNLIGFGIKDINISVNYLKHKIIDHFKDGSDLGCKITYLNEDKPLNTGGPIKLLNNKAESFFVLNGDILCNFNASAMLNQHVQSCSDITIGASNYNHQIPFGCIDIQNNKVNRITEKPTIERLVNAGIYLCRPSITDLIVANESLPMTEVIDRALSAKKVVKHYLLDDWIDIGNQASLDLARGNH